MLEQKADLQQLELIAKKAFSAKSSQVSALNRQTNNDHLLSIFWYAIVESVLRLYVSFGKRSRDSEAVRYAQEENCCSLNFV